MPPSINQQMQSFLENCKNTCSVLRAASRCEKEEVGKRRGRGEVLRFSSGGGVQAPACGGKPLIIPAHADTHMHANVHEHPHACGPTSDGTNTEGPAPISPKHARQSIKHARIHPIKPSIFHVRVRLHPRQIRFPSPLPSAASESSR